MRQKVNQKFEFRHKGYCDICERSVEFRATETWFRNHLVCPVCQSIP